DLGLARLARAEGEQGPAPGDALELVKAPVLEREGAAHDGPEDGARHEHLTGAGQRVHARGDVDRHAADVLADQLALARVHPHAYVDAELAGRLSDRQRAAQRPRGRAVEGGEKAVAEGLHLTAAKAGELLAHLLVVPREQIAPAAVADDGGARGGIDDVGEHD